MAPAQDSFDVVIIGGGVIGSSIAYFLAAANEKLSVAVIEADPTYEWSATPRSAGGIRSQFSTRENILMSLYGADFIRAAPELLAVDGEPPFLSFREKGYLTLSTAAGQAQLQANQEVQNACGASVLLLDAAALSQRFPWLETDGIAMGAFGERNEGWLDPYSLLQAFRRKARACGAQYFTDTVVGLDRNGNRISGVKLQSGRVLTCGLVVNAAGLNGRAVAEMAGIHDLPIYRKKRQIFVFTCRTAVPDMPMLIDPSGVYCRPENEHFICGRSPDEENDPETASFEVDHSQFENDIWPILAERVPEFEAIKVINAWAGHYDMNIVDHNAVLGPHPDIANFHFANGFSGHGLQQSPAVGRALSELIIQGHYATLDLHKYRFARFAENQPIVEMNVI